MTIQPKIFICALIILTLWLNRFIFFQNYDQKYFSDYYSFSQWALPLSSRVLPDGKLYQHAGSQLYINFDPYALNPEAPPLGKLLIGLSIHLFDNAYIVTTFMWLLLLGILAKFAQKFFDFDSTSVVILLSLAITSPLLIEQMTHTLLDLPQVTFMLLHMLFLFYPAATTNKRKRLLHFTLAGLFLGAVAATKIAVYIPFIIAIDIWYLYAHSLLKYASILLISTFVAYVATYAPYIINHGLMQWISGQKWMINFYRNSQVDGAIGMVFITCFTGIYKGWWNGGWQKIQQWSPMWAIGIISLSRAALLMFKSKQTHEFKYLILTGISVLLTITVVPFWPRYLVFLLPFFWITCIHWLRTTKYLSALYIVVIFQLLLLARPNLDDTLSDFYVQLKIAAFEEQYEFFTTQKKAILSRDEFVQEQLNNLNNNDTYEIQVEDNKDKSHIYVLHKGIVNTALYTYKTEWILEHNQWKIDTLELESTQLQDSTATVPYSQAHCILPTQVKDWSKTYSLAAELTNTSQETIKESVMKLVPQNYCIPLNLKPNLEANVKLLEENGIIQLETQTDD